jgi:hypothetical protein
MWTTRRMRVGRSTGKSVLDAVGNLSLPDCREGARKTLFWVRRVGSYCNMLPTEASIGARSETPYSIGVVLVDSSEQNLSSRVRGGGCNVRHSLAW